MTSVETVGELGEHELIRLITPYVTVGAGSDGSFGIGDDCASLPPSSNFHSLYTTDLLVEGTHFLRTENTNWRWVGYKAAAANISDLAAAGAAPAGLLVSIGLPPDFPADHLRKIYHGLHEACSNADTAIIGGDTTRSAQAIISVTALGRKSTDAAVCLRSDAVAGDNVFVTGSLGGSRAGLEILLDKHNPRNFSPDHAKSLIRRHFMPPLRVPFATAIAAANQRVCMIDISDSLYNEAGLIAAASGAGIAIDLDLIPVEQGLADYCKISGVDPAEFALFSGEEYELLFTLPLSVEDVQEQLDWAGVDCPVTKIGTVTNGTGLFLCKDGKALTVQNQTFTHF